MNLWTIARYLFGEARAIRTVAESSAALPAGIILVLLTAIARNYDQSYWRENPLWLLGPLLFSFISGAWLFFILFRFVRRHFGEVPVPAAHEQWRSFMGLFWMTAPIAWLYALPVERFFTSVGAAKANITLLAIVSFWRVVLMSRVVSVVTGAPLLRSLGWVATAASGEVILVVFCGGTFGARGVLASMGGMRNAPEEDVLLNALGVSWVGAWIVLLVAGAYVTFGRYHGSTQPFPRTIRGSAPWFGLAALAALWTLAAIPAQMEQRRFVEHATLIGNQRYLEAMEYLAQYQRDDFPPQRRLEPNPYEHRVWAQLPPVLTQLKTNTPPWIREVYLEHASALLKHYPRFRSFETNAAMLLALEKLPEGSEWIRNNQERVANRFLLSTPIPERPNTVETNLQAALTRLGLTNRDFLKWSNYVEERK